MMRAVDRLGIRMRVHRMPPMRRCVLHNNTLAGYHLALDDGGSGGMMNACGFLGS